MPLLKNLQSVFTPYQPSVRFHKLPLALALLAPPILTPSIVSASAIRIGFKDAEATARGNAFVATADNPSAIYYNPAGLTQIEGQMISGTVFAIQLESERTSPGGQKTKLKEEFKPVPQIYYAFSPENSPWSFGLGAYAPFGLATEWPGTSDFATLATKSSLTTYDVAAIAAYQITPTFSVGAGPVFHRSEGDLRRNFTPVNEYVFKGKGNTAGFSAGARWEPTPRHAFGVSYQHEYEVKMKGSSAIDGIIASQPASADFQFPEVIIVGYSFRPTPKWNLEVNADWTNWDRVNGLTVETAAPLASTQPFNWQSSFYYDAGVTRYFDNGFSVSAGYTFAENSIPDSTYSPAIPDADRHIFSVGFGYKHDRLAFHINYQYAYSPDRTVQNSPTGPGFPAGQTGDGIYRNRYHAISTSLAYEF